MSLSMSTTGDASLHPQPVLQDRGDREHPGLCSTTPTPVIFTLNQDSGEVVQLFNTVTKIADALQLQPDFDPRSATRPRSP